MFSNKKNAAVIPMRISLESMEVDRGRVMEVSMKEKETIMKEMDRMAKIMMKEITVKIMMRERAVNTGLIAVVLVDMNFLIIGRIIMEKLEFKCQFLTKNQKKKVKRETIR